MIEEPVDFVISYLEKRGSLPQDRADLLRCRYLDLGLIGSLEIIGFILELEERFGIALSAEDTQSDAFRTIGGVAAMVKSKMGS
ncbi:MAG: acyl carrier protein [Magnetococcus sp. MYC-9]